MTKRRPRAAFFCARDEGDAVRPRRLEACLQARCIGTAINGDVAGRWMGPESGSGGAHQGAVGAHGRGQAGI